LKVLLLLLLCFSGLQAQTPISEESRWEGSSLHVQCPYTAQMTYLHPKAWCRLKAGKCEVLVETSYDQYSPSSQATSGRVLIEDEPILGTVSVTMSKLQAEDSGTYCCAYQSQPPYYTLLRVISLNVFKELALHALSAPSRHSGKVPMSSHTASNSSSSSFSSSALSLSMLGAAGVSWASLLLNPLILAHSKGNREGEDTYAKPEDTAQLSTTKRMESPKDDSKDLKYATLSFKSQPSPEDTLYCNIEPSQAPRRAEEENVDYAVIRLKKLPANEK
ncbi:TREM1 protein, partial [Galbula dea]|nr:TREM1 protein [Galbula dea]